MATTNGLPTLKIAFEKAAAQVANRSKKGYVAMMVRDASAQGVHLLSSDALIPSGLGEENKKHILTAFEGSDRGAPSLVILVVIKEGTEDTTALEGGLKAIEQYSIDYLAGLPDVTDDEMAKMVEWVKAQRELYRTVMLVKPWKTAGADHMGIIELDETGHDRQGRRGDGGGVLRPLRWYPGRHPHGHERHLRGPARAHRRGRPAPQRNRPRRSTTVS